MGYKHLPQPAQPPQRLAYDPVEAAKLLSCSRRKIYEMMAGGTLASVKIKKQRRIPHTELMRIIGELPAQRFAGNLVEELIHGLAWATVPTDITKASMGWEITLPFSARVHASLRQGIDQSDDGAPCQKRDGQEASTSRRSLDTSAVGGGPNAQPRAYQT